MNFLAAVLEEQNTPLALYTLEVPTIEVGQVLVKVSYSGICGAQLGEIAGTKGPDKFLPHCMGHEGGGVVVECGPGVRYVKDGDHVVMHWRKGQGIESNCPRYYCPELGKHVGGGWVTSFNEYAVVSENRLTRIDPNIPLDVAALMGCAVTTGMGIVSNELQIKPGQSVVVLGCGGVGQNVLQGCMLATAYPIIGVDLTEDKLQAAKIMGASHTLFSTDTTLADIMKITGKGADIVIDTTGNQKVMELAWEAAAPAGKVCLAAQLRFDQRIAIQTLPVHSGKTLIGSDGGRTNPTDDIPRYLRLYQAGRLNLKGLISHCVPLPDINNILDLIRASRVSRAIIRM